MTESTAHVSEPREEVKLKTLGFLLLLNERINGSMKRLSNIQCSTIFCILYNYVHLCKLMSNLCILRMCIHISLSLSTRQDEEVDMQKYLVFCMKIVSEIQL